MIKKANIITFHCVPNYGAVLQAYALQEVLKRYIEDVEILDYRPQKLIDEYKVINFYSIFSVMMTVWSALPFINKKRKFNQFMNDYLSISKEKGKTNNDFKSLNTDLLVLGSDQVWNPDITGGFDKLFFGNVSCSSKYKVVSYAASLGKSNFSQSEKEIMKELLLNVDKISVREPDAKNIIDELIENKSQVVVDPTILAGKSCFKPLVKNVREKPYVLLYSLNGYKETEALAIKVSKYLGIQLIELSGRRKPLVKKKHKAMYDAGPIEFVSYIANANYVITDSFHGSVFSLLFHKDIFTVPHKTRGSRTKNLMKIANLEDRLIDHFDKVIFNKSIDWNLVDERLEKERKESLKFIEDFLKEYNE